MHTKEQKILKFSMILLFLALMIVYVVWYQVQGHQLSKNKENTNGSGIQIITKSGEVVPTISIGERIQNTGGITGIDEILSMTGDTTIHTGIQKTSTGQKSDANSAITVLSGTSIYYGTIDIIEKLGIKYQYALTDTQGVRYIYLGTPSYDFASIARALKGNIYTIATEQELIQNKLFGNKVVFINLPEYQDKQVIMLIYMNDGIWLLQVDYAFYHKSKAYIKSLFID